MFPIIASTGDEAWRRAEEELHRYGKITGSRVGRTVELLHMRMCVTDPRQRFILSRSPAINPAFAIAEVVWILQGRNDAAFVNFWNPLLPKFAGYDDTYHGAYGHRLRKHFGIDQLQAVYDEIMSGKTEASLVIFDIETDMSNSDGTARAPDIPCNVMSNLLVRNGTLHWSQYMRSNDLYLGTPHNFVQFMTLHEVMAGWLRLKVGPYVHTSDSLHVYTKGDLPPISKPVNIPHNTDNLALVKQVSERALSTVGTAMDHLREDTLTVPEFDCILSDVLLTTPIGWSNLFLIAAADAARRKGWDYTATMTARQCTNPLLKCAWDRWVVRTQEITRDSAK